MLMLSNSFQEIISFVISSHQIITYREEVYSEHCQTFKMEHCAKRIIPKCSCKIRHFQSGRRGGRGGGGGGGGGGGVHGTMALQ